VRLFPLTGVTLPFVSYGGSSLLTSFLALLILLFISSQPEEEPAPLPNPQPYLILAGLIGAGLFSLAIANAWWAVWRGPDLLQRTDNARRSIDERYVKRGSLLDRNGTPIDFTLGKSEVTRVIMFTPTWVRSPAIPTRSMARRVWKPRSIRTCAVCRGIRPAASGGNHLVYGEPPPGLNVRLSIDLDLQKRADALLADRAGAVVLLNAQTGEILANRIPSHLRPQLAGSTSSCSP